MYKKLSLLVSLLTLSTLVHAVNKQNIVIKVKDNTLFEKEYKSQKIKKLFKNLYVIRDTTIDINHFRNNKNTIYVETENISEKRELSIETSNLFSPILLNEVELNDPELNRVWSFGDSVNHGISVLAARREFGVTSEPFITVAVIDTGVEYNHDDLKNKMWINLKEIPGNKIDDDGNGYVDDIYGINTLHRLSDSTASGDIRDTQSHGTHVAGTIGAEANNLIGIAGIASNVKIMAIKTIPNFGDESDINVAESMIYAANNGAKVINCSFGKKRNEGGNLIPETLEYLNEKGVIVVAASGNDGTNNDRVLQYPASLQADNLITVASTSIRGVLSGFSNYGVKSVHVAAPGSDIYSTAPRNKYLSMTGTSMAAPAVAGVVAEILSFYPHLTPVEVKELIMRTSDKLDTLEGKVSSGGRVNLLKALEEGRNL